MIEVGQRLPIKRDSQGASATALLQELGIHRRRARVLGHLRTALSLPRLTRAKVNGARGRRSSLRNAVQADAPPVSYPQLRDRFLG